MRCENIKINMTLFTATPGYEKSQNCSGRDFHRRATRRIIVISRRVVSTKGGEAGLNKQGDLVRGERMWIAKE